MCLCVCEAKPSPDPGPVPRVPACFLLEFSPASPGTLIGAGLPREISTAPKKRTG
jgi:hypothetical protein